MLKIEHNWQDLPVSRKAYLIGLIIATISPFLPWFTDTNQFVNGSTYLGLTGPTSFMGLSIFLFSVLALVQETYFLIKGNLLMGDTVGAWLYNGLGVTNLYLAGLAASVFLHPSVGDNLLAKNLQWGFYVAVVSFVATMIGIFLKQPTAKPQRQHQRITSHSLNLEQEENERPKLDPDANQLRSLKIEDVLPQAAGIDTGVRNLWDKQKALEHKINNAEDANTF